MICAHGPIFHAPKSWVGLLCHFLSFRTVDLSVCLSVCPVCPDCNVGISWPNGWTDQDVTWYNTELGLGPDEIVLNGDPAPPTERGTAAPRNFSAHV